MLNTNEIIANRGKQKRVRSNCREKENSINLDREDIEKTEKCLLKEIQGIILMFSGRNGEN